MPQNAASDLDLHCLPISHKKDARLKWVNSDFIWDFGKLPFPSHLGKYFIKIGN